MGRLRFITGALGIIVGFFVYEYGFFLTLDLYPSLSSWSVALLPWVVSSVVFGALLQLTGGVLAIVGLLLCIAWIGSQSMRKTMMSRLPRTSEPDTQVPLSVRRCKFCEATMESDSVFCPQCQRAQV